jgi:UDPglucose 6-dehydrogenase
MKIGIFGTGYVGLVSGVCFADLGNDVICVDVDAEKVALLKSGVCPIYEPGLKEKLERSLREERLIFTTDAKTAIMQSDLLFICVGTPPKEDGSVDLSYVESVAQQIGKELDHETVIINKSTVPVGTVARVRELIEQGLKQRESAQVFHVVSNPEFLREGAAVYDFFNPDRIVVGLEEKDLYAEEQMGKLYRSVARTGRPILFTDTKSAELIKYASNTMLATRISFMNQLSSYCEKIGADITAVAKGIGLDTRIGSRFLHAGVGYGGSCFPKDVKGLIKSIEESGCDASIFAAVDAANELQKQSLFPKIKKMLGDIKGKRVALWGLSFKPKTDDIREAPSLVVVEWLQKHGASVAAFDPEAMQNFKKEFPDISYGDNPYEVLEDADLLIVLTEWDAFRNPDWNRVKSLMKEQKIIDGRNIYLAYRDEFESFSFSYQGVGVR